MCTVWKHEAQPCPQRVFRSGQFLEPYKKNHGKHKEFTQQERRAGLVIGLAADNAKSINASLTPYCDW